MDATKENRREKKRRILDDGKSRKRILIVGANETAQRIADELNKEGTGNCHVVGFVEDGEPACNGIDNECLGNREDILDVVDAHDVDEVIVCEPLNWQEIFLRGMVGNGHSNLQVKVVPSVYEAMLGIMPLDTVDDIPLVELGRRRRRGLYEVLKPIFEKSAALIGLICTFPILLLAMIAVKLESQGSAVYRQERVGVGGESFILYKLRTMVDKAEAKSGPRLSSVHDERITAIGRFLRNTKIDEIPQLLNVLKGEMSLVGPRPERPCFVAEYQNRIPHYKERHRVRPGMTGLAQVYGDYSTSPETKLRYDLMYVYNQSLWLDVKVLSLTFRAVYKEFSQQASTRIQRKK